MANKLIDISEHQGPVNWDAIQDALLRGDIIGVIIRAGYGTATGMQKDGQFDRNRDEARKREIPRQFYGFAYPGRSAGAVQAKGMAGITGNLERGESISLDLEDEPSYGRMLTASDVQWSYDFVATLRNYLGPVPLTYMNSNVLGRYNFAPLVEIGSGLWQANYGPNDGSPHTEPSPGEWPFNAIWQYTSKANMAGINPVDANIFNGEREAFLAYGLKGDAPVIPPTPPAATDPAPVAGIGTSYVLGKDVPGYVTAADAGARRNSNSTAKAGTYYVFNQYAGMINITKQPGVPGYWINPADNVVASAPAAPSGNFQAATPLPGFYTAADAAAHRNQVNTVPAGSYFVFNTYQGMVNITSVAGSPGTWINPGDNIGAPQNIPAPLTHKVVKGDTVDGISGQYGLSKSNNYAQFRALNTSSGHGGDWTNLWPGDIVRVR